MYWLSYKYRLGNLQESRFISIGEVIKVKFTATKLMYQLSIKYRLGNLQVSRLGNL